MKKKILVFGISSFLGKNIINFLSPTHEIHGTYFKSRPNFKKKIKIKKVDLSERNFFKHNYFQKCKPDLIINCAGESDVNFCENNKNKCKKKILFITRNTSDFAKKKKIYYVTISTDILFKNIKCVLSSEKDKPNPYNFYGKLKLAAEKYVKKSNSNSLIVRTRFFGLNSNNDFFTNILKLKNSKKKLICYDNIYSTPIYVNDLIKSIVFCFDKKVKGVVHISGNESISRFRFATLVAKIFKINNNLIVKKTLKSSDCLENNIYSSSLSNKKIKKKINFTFKKLSAAIKEIKYNLK
jgi:dTDP-4-dehydrorhamnose reductase